MRFTREDELDGAFRIVDDLIEALFVLDDEECAFVFGETAREADREGVGVKDMLGGVESGGIGAGAFELATELAAREVDESLLEREVRFPKLAGIDVVDARPDFRVDRLFLPTGDATFKKILDLRGHP